MTTDSYIESETFWFERPDYNSNHACDVIQENAICGHSRSIERKVLEREWKKSAAFFTTICNKQFAEVPLQLLQSFDKNTQHF